MNDFFAQGLGDGLQGLVLALLLSALLVPLIIKLAWKIGVVDRPRSGKVHTRTTPLMGGVAIALSFLAITLLFPLWQHLTGATTPFPTLWNDSGLRGFLVGCLLAAILGVTDEVLTLKPRWHFLGQILVVIGAIVAGFPMIQKVSNPFLQISATTSTTIDLVARFGPVAAWIMGALFTLFWVVGMMNTVNFLDGLDGLAGGVSAIAALFLGLWAVVVIRVHGYPPTHDNQNVVLPLILCGAALGFLIYNWAPARIFMGDSGAMFLGFALGALSIFGPVKLGTAMLLLIVPIMDVAWAIVRRTRSGRSFTKGDQQHIFNRMIEIGLSRRSVVLIFYAVCTGLGIIDLSVTKKTKLLIFLIVAVLAAISAVLLEARGRRATARHSNSVTSPP